MRAAVFKSGKQVPALGQGTWHLGEGEHDRSQEVAALREGIQLGMTLIDTAEMYGEGVVGGGFPASPRSGKGSELGRF
jgi:diketogulonate reductase-like aldo/keto reductase